MRNEKFTMILTGTRRGLQAVPRKFALSCLLFLLPLLHAYSQRSGLGKDSDDFSSYLLQYLVSDPNLDKDTKEYLEEAVPGYLAFYAALDKNVREEVASLPFLLQGSPEALPGALGLPSSAAADAGAAPL